MNVIFNGDATFLYRIHVNSLATFAHTKIDFQQSPDMRPAQVGIESSIRWICVQPGLDGGVSRLHHITLTYSLADEAR